jgi:hypothetical protein
MVCVCSFLLIYGRGVSSILFSLVGFSSWVSTIGGPWSVEGDSTTLGRLSEEEGVSSPSSSEADFKDVVSSTTSVFGASGSFRTLTVPCESPVKIFQCSL